VIPSHAFQSVLGLLLLSHKLTILFALLYLLKLCGEGSVLTQMKTSEVTCNSLSYSKQGYVQLDFRYDMNSNILNIL